MRRFLPRNGVWSGLPLAETIMRRFFRTSGLLLSLAGVGFAFSLALHADDGAKGANCKAGWHMCWCKREGRPRRLCETDYLWKKCDVCWGQIAQHQCLKGKKDEVLDQAFAEAKKADKLVLYIGNTGG